MTMSILENAGYEQYEISNYARPGFESVHNRAYWTGENYLGIGPSAFSTVDQQRWQNIANYSEYSDRLFSDQSPIASVEDLTVATKRAERIAIGLRTRDGVPVDLLDSFKPETSEFVWARFASTAKRQLRSDPRRQVSGRLGCRKHFV